MGAMNCRRCNMPCSHYYNYDLGYLCSKCINDLEEVARGMGRVMTLSEIEEFMDGDEDSFQVSQDISYIREQVFQNVYEEEED